MLSQDARDRLLDAIREQFVPSWDGWHGRRHWERVQSNALAIADVTPDVDPEVCELFALFHDAARVNEGEDDGHGARGADLARRFRGEYFECSLTQLEQLCRAATYHSDGLIKDKDPTVLACWDADRLDLPRVGVIPDPELLCTEFARSIAYARHGEGLSRSRLPATALVDDSNQAALMFHGTGHVDGLDPAKTVDGGLHFGSYAQAHMRAAGAGNHVVPAYLVVRNACIARDSGGEWKSKIRRARSEGYDAIVYLNRYEGIPNERYDQLRAGGPLERLDQLSDHQFRKIVPEARESVIVWEARQVIALPAVRLVRRPTMQRPSFTMEPGMS